MHAKPLDTLLLFSLPASGKSEMRRYLASLTPEQCRDEFGMGPTAQLDDYPYVHLMHRMDDELQSRGYGYKFYLGPTRPFIEEWTWAALIELLNEDYANLRKGVQTEVASAAQLLFDRMDAARVRAGMLDVMGDLPYKIRKSVAEALEKECRAELDVLNRQNAQGIEGKTIVIEAARGGPNGSAFPLCPPHGYATAFQHLSTDILERSSLMYIWVEPAQSRAKNIERGLPDGQGSILNHSVPMEVMLGQYGCDDMAYLLEHSDRPGTIKVERLVAEGNRYLTKTYHIPAARFDNRADLTTFVRAPRETWKAEDIAAIQAGLKETFRAFGR
jgi:hypothetical protein